MKKFLISAVLSVLVITGSFAAGRSNKKAVDNFKAAFVNATNIAWEYRNDFTKVTYNLDDKDYASFYDYDGELVGTSTDINVADLPKNTKRALAKKCAGYVVTSAISFDGAEEHSYYVAAENDRETVVLKVDSNGFVSTFKTIKK